jgi:hypothetical protein
MKTRVIMLGMWLLIAAILPACGQANSNQHAAPDKVTVQLKWIHQAQFAGPPCMNDFSSFYSGEADVTTAYTMIFLTNVYGPTP